MVKQMSSHDTHGWSCGCWYYLGAFLWVLAAAALVCAWVATAKGAAFGFGPDLWYGNALILGVLAIPLKMRGRGMGCEGGSCK